MHSVAAFFASIIAFVSGFFAPTVASNSPVDVRTTQPAAASAAQTEIVGDPFNDPAAASAVAAVIPATAPAPAFSPPPTQTVINQPVIERIIERIVPQGGTISAETLTAILTDFEQSIGSRIAALNPTKATIPEQVAAAGNATGAFFPAAQRIDQLTNTAINTPTITGGSISGASVSGYLPLSGGTLTGALSGTDLSLSGNLTAGTLSVDGLSSSGVLFAPYFTATSTTASQFPYASSTMLSVSSTGYFGTATTTNLFAQTAALGSLTLPSIPSALLVTNASGQAGAYAGSVCTNQFARSLNGAGVATCAPVSLTADVTGVLPIANGGTGTTTLSGYVYCNGVGSCNGVNNAIDVVVTCGADKTGLTNSRTAIQTCFNTAVATGHATVVFPDGQYLISGGTVQLFGASNVMIRGSSRSGVTILNGNTNVPAIQIGNNVSLDYGNGIEDMTFASAGGVTGVSGQTGLSIYKQGHFQLSNLRFTNYPAALYDGLLTSGLSQTMINNVEVQGTLNRGTQWWSGGDIYVSNMRSDSNGAEGYYFSDVQGLYFQNVTAYSNGTNAYKFVHGSNENKNIFFSNVIGDTSSSTNWSIADARNFWCVNCWGSTQKSTTVNTSASGFLITTNRASNVNFIGGGALNNNGQGVNVFDDGVNGSPLGIKFNGFSFGSDVRGNGQGGIVGYGLIANGTADISIIGGQMLGNLNGPYTIGAGNSISGFATSTAFFVDQNGRVGIGTSSPTAQLHTTGTVRFSNFGAGTLTTDASGNLSVASDERLKSIDGAFSRGLSDILKLSPIQYHWNDLSGLDRSTQYAGFSAQNVQTAIPEAVGMSMNGYLSLQDRPLIAAIVNAIKELSAKLDTLATLVSGFAESFSTKRLCVDDICVTREQFAAMVAASGQTPDSPSPVPANNSAPVIELNGNATSTIEVGNTYNDLGARIVAPENDINLGIVILLDGATTSAISIDTTAPGEHSILYTVTSPTSGLTGSAMRTVFVSPATQSSEPPANDNPFNAPPANDNVSTSTLLNTEPAAVNL